MATTDRLEEGAPTIEELQQKVEEKPGELEPLRELGWALYGLDRVEEAIEALSDAQGVAPQDPETAYALGLALKQAGKKQEARQSFERALDNVDSIEVQIRADMLRKLSQGQINLLDHGSWDIQSI